MSELPYEIIHRAIHGSPSVPATREAFERLYLHHEPDVRKAVARVAVWKSQEADEICQEVWCRLLDGGRRRLQRFDPDRGSGFGPFLRRVAFFEALGILRLRRMRPMGGSAAPVPADELEDDRASDFVGMLVQHDLFDRLVAEAARELGQDALVVLEEVFLRERSCADLARELGVKENTITQRKLRIKRKLREICDRMLDDGPNRRPPSEATSVVMAGLVLLVWMVARG